MAGYLFTFSDIESLREAISRGSYSTLMSPKWGDTVASTLGDYVTMCPGDSVYFFSNRTVYGIGELISLSEETVAAESYRGATLKSRIDYAIINLDSFVDDPVVEVEGRNHEKKHKVKRWTILFKPSPYFFTTGIDMDDLLSSNPEAFKSLRVFERRSFIKLDPEEELAFKTAILRRNISALKHPDGSNTYACNYESTRNTYLSRMQGRNVRPDVKGLLASSRNSRGVLSSEMLLEVGLLNQLAIHDNDTEQVFGAWDYLSHQVSASPMKPVQWVDRMDVFAFRYITDNAPIIEKFGIIELKKDTASGNDIQQVMKYVDWVNREYGTGDYSLIEAFLVAHDFDRESIKRLDETAERQFTLGRPARSKLWHNITYVTYSVEADGYISFEIFRP